MEPASRAPGDLDRLPGVGPGLIWALERAGLFRLADLAPLSPAELAAFRETVGLALAEFLAEIERRGAAPMPVRVPQFS